MSGTDYRPGHSVHVIQASKAFGDPDAWEAGRLQSGFSETVTIKYGDGREIQYWCVHAQALMRYATQDGTGRREVEVAERWRVLRIRLPGTEGRAPGSPPQFYNKDGNCVGALDAESRPLYVLFCLSTEGLEADAVDADGAG